MVGDGVDDRLRLRIFGREPVLVCLHCGDKVLYKLRVFGDEIFFRHQHRLRPAVFAAVKRLQVADIFELTV